MFERLEIAKQVYKGESTSKTTVTEYSKRSSHGSKRQQGKSALPTNPEKGRTGKSKKNMQDIRTIGQTEKEYACCMSPDTPQISVKY